VHARRPQVPLHVKFSLGQSASFWHWVGAQRASAPQVSPRGQTFSTLQPWIQVGWQMQPEVSQIIDTPMALQSASLLHGSGGISQMPQPGGVPGGAQNAPGIEAQSLMSRHWPCESAPPLPVVPVVVLPVVAMPPPVDAEVPPPVDAEVPPPVPFTSLPQAARRAGVKQRRSAQITGARKVIPRCSAAPPRLAREMDGGHFGTHH
jgi:hypothetical protein